MRTPATDKPAVLARELPGGGLIDVHLHTQADRRILHLVNLSGANPWPGYHEQPIPAGPILAELPGVASSARARSLVTGQEWTGPRLEIPRLEEHDVLAWGIDFAPRRPECWQRWAGALKKGPRIGVRRVTRHENPRRAKRARGASRLYTRRESRNIPQSTCVRPTMKQHFSAAGTALAAIPTLSMVSRPAASGVREGLREIPGKR